MRDVGAGTCSCQLRAQSCGPIMLAVGPRIDWGVGTMLGITHEYQHIRTKSPPDLGD